MGRTANAAQAARARARERLVDLERERIERQRRIEDAATVVYLAVEKRLSACALVSEAEREIASALRAILAEGADVERTATLCDLTPAYVRRLARQRSTAHGRETADEISVRASSNGSADAGV